jgi:hypothetical protein
LKTLFICLCTGALTTYCCFEALACPSSSGDLSTRATMRFAMRTLIHNNRENHAPRTRVGFERLWLSAPVEHSPDMPSPRETVDAAGMRNYSAATSKSDLTVALGTAARIRLKVRGPRRFSLRLSRENTAILLTYL